MTRAASPILAVLLSLSGCAGSGASIVGEGSILKGRCDILEHRAEGRALDCKAEYHEDRHDPGDSSVVELVLERPPSPSGDTLVLRQGNGAPPVF